MTYNAGFDVTEPDRYARPHRGAGTRLGLRTAAALLACALLAGCNVIGVAAYKFSGPPTVPAKFKPAAQEPMLVLVENSRNPTNLRMDADRLARSLATELKQHKV